MTTLPDNPNELQQGINDLQALSRPALMVLARFGHDTIRTSSYEGFFISDFRESIPQLAQAGLVEIADRSEKLLRNQTEDRYVLTARGRGLARLLVATRYGPESTIEPLAALRKLAQVQTW
jgi:hypothetical protein